MTKPPKDETVMKWIKRQVGVRWRGKDKFYLKFKDVICMGFIVKNPVATIIIIRPIQSKSDIGNGPGQSYEIEFVVTEK